MKWTAQDIPDQTGRTALVTGSNSGIGYETARALAQAGAHVVMACRSPERAEAAAERIRAEGPAGRVEVAQLDLSSLASVQRFSESFLAANDRLDLLIANAGVMMPPERRETSDGHELQIGTNHLGHFALVGRLLPALLSTAGSRVVVVASAAHRWGSMDFDDLSWRKRSYRRMPSYGQSKLANLLFVKELQRRLEEAGASTLVTAAHPGWTSTELQRDTALFRWLNPFLAMTADQGALPTLRAAVAPDAEGADYYGPDGWMEMRGWPVKVGRSKE
ncbi:MAG: oxidoreductase, partial [Acidobacteriota bacterium]